MSRTSNDKLLELATKTYKYGYKPIRFKTYNANTQECCFLGAAAIAKGFKHPNLFDICSTMNVFNRSASFLQGVIQGFDGGVLDSCTYSGSKKKAFIRGYKLGQQANKLFKVF